MLSWSQYLARGSTTGADAVAVATTAAVPMSKVGEKLAPYNPTSPEAIEIAISLLNIGDGDVVYDLGCGDGR
jgi:hypothetical protein